MSLWVMLLETAETVSSWCSSLVLMMGCAVIAPSRVTNIRIHKCIDTVVVKLFIIDDAMVVDVGDLDPVWCCIVAHGCVLSCSNVDVDSKSR